MKNIFCIVFWLAKCVIPWLDHHVSHRHVKDNLKCNIYSSSLLISVTKMYIFALSIYRDIIRESCMLPAFFLHTIPAMVKYRSIKALVTGIFCIKIY